ncbi:MAG TPA: amidohydrolase, partial [Gemmatimonadaceae bacterium]|nr:amidohydrolase [Gemmatimonadaceae bacterium]
PEVPSVSHRSVRALLPAALLALPALLAAQSAPSATLAAEIDRRAAAVMPKVVAWRRDIHEHPELSNRETRTGKLVADHLRSLGLEVRAGVAKTGVVGVLKGGRPGPVVALRADMDALPVVEETGLPFASTVRSTYNGQDVGVMHACGHDTHVAMLLGAAEVLAGMRERIPGTIVFLFQPAEEGAPPGEDGGAGVMIREGALANPAPGAIFGLHVFSRVPTGHLTYRPAGLMASSDQLRIVVRGRQTHGALPWQGVDPIVVASQIVLGLQTITSRQTDVTLAPAVVTVGRISGGTRFNIIPDSVVLEGTIRAFDPAMQKDIHQRVTRTAEHIAQSAGATARVSIRIGNPVTYNDPALVARMVPTLERVAGTERTSLATPTTTAEDFALYQQKIPGMFVFLGVTPPESDMATVAANHSPKFMVDEAALPTGVRALAHLAVDWLSGPSAQ